MLPQKPTRSEWIRITFGLVMAVIGVVGTNLLRIYGYPNPGLLVVSILIWITSWISLTVIFWSQFVKLGKSPWLAIFTLVSPIISTGILLFWVRQLHNQNSHDA